MSKKHISQDRTIHCDKEHKTYKIELIEYKQFSMQCLQHVRSIPILLAVGFSFGKLQYVFVCCFHR